MSRRMIPRKIDRVPVVTQIKASPKRAGGMDRTLKEEELEAIRLKDFVGLSQGEAAEKMEVSRQLFQQILKEARRKVAATLYYGGTIKIDGGFFEAREEQIDD